jgi:radical SAM superfamily enzyme YgiQ (UPF0313 family)
MTMQPLRIFLGDLTYTTLSIANESFPLNIGYVAAHCKKVFGDRVELTLFKYIHDLERAIKEAPPDVLALSNYPWNHSLGRELMAWTRTLRPDTLCIMGGSNISHDASEQAVFMARATELDAHVYLEGEHGFANLIERIMTAVDPSDRREALNSAPVSGCLTRDNDNGFVRGPLETRITALDDIPSPYLEGLMDPFFDGKLSPMMETNRGCPFTCTFCHEGTSLYRKINFFSTERVLAELNYIAERVPPQVHNLMFCDPNFAMYPRDIEICEAIAEIQAKQNWPTDIFASTGKNKKDRIAGSLKKLNGAMQMWISVQSMDKTVLENVKRGNIRLDAMLALTDMLVEQGTPTKSEIILGLPGETLESHTRGISELVAAGIDTISTYQLMLLDGTEMNTPSEREKWAFETGYRVLPRDFGKLSNGKNVVEIEEVVVATKDLSFEDYIAARRLHLLLAVLYNGKGFASLFKYLAEQNADVFELFRMAVDRIDTAPQQVKDLVLQFEAETRSELWDSPEALREFVSDDENYDRMVAGDVGANLLQKFVAVSLVEATEGWTQYLFAIANEVLQDKTSEVQQALDSIQNYCQARVSNIFTDDRHEPVSAVLTHDIDGWMTDPQQGPISDHINAAPQILTFRVSDDQLALTKDYLERFGSNHQGIGKALTKMNIVHVWRHSSPPPKEKVEPSSSRQSA